MVRDQLNRYLMAAFRRLVSRRTWLRGRRARPDRLITLLTVDYHATGDAVRLIRSFRRFVDPEGPVVVVQNGSCRANRHLRGVGARVKNIGYNLGHGLGLDYGMRSVSTEYTLICDPDTAIIGPGFREEMVRRVDQFGAASVDNGCTFYHPICLLFRTELWKERPFSFEHRWYMEPYWDVAGALTHELGGLREEALLPRTRSAGPPLASSRPGRVHYYGDVFGDVFTNTYCVSRRRLEPDRKDFDGWSAQELDRYHDAWRAWVAAVIDGHSTVGDFPSGAVAAEAGEGVRA